MEKEREPVEQTSEEPACTDDMENPQQPVDPPENQGGGGEPAGNVTTLSDF